MTQDGFYFYNGSLIAKVGNNILELVSQSGTSYVSFLIEQDTTDEQKYTALKNIGFVYKSIENSNIYPKNGIIYIEDSQSLFIVKDGVLSKYSVSIPNPYTKQFIIHKEDNEEGALIIEGIGVENSLKFDSLKIYSEGLNSVFEAEKEYKFKIQNKQVVNISLNGIKADGIESFDANDEQGYRIYRDEGKYILEIDKIRVRYPEEEEEQKFDYLDTKIYTERYIIDSVKIETDLYNENYGQDFVNDERCIINTNHNTSTYNIHYIDNIKVTTIQDSEFVTSTSNGKKCSTLIQIPLRVIRCNACSVNPSNYLIINQDEENHTYEQVTCYLEPVNAQNYHNTISRPNTEVINICLETTDVNGVLKYKFQNVSSHIMMLDYLPYLSIDGEMREFIKLCDYNSDTNISTVLFYVIDGPSLEDMLLDRTMYICSDEKDNISCTKSRILYDFENSEISLLQNNNNIRNLDHVIQYHDVDTHFKLGNVGDFRSGNQDTNAYGLFSDSNVFVGAEFRHPLPIKVEEEQIPSSNNYTVTEKEADVNFRDFPRYSQKLCNDANRFITNDEIILPRKYAQKVTVEDFTTITSTFDTVQTISQNYINIYQLSPVADDVVLYNGKLILLKLNGQVGYNSYVKILKNVTTVDSGGNYSTSVESFYYPIKMDNNLIIEGQDYDVGTVLLLRYNNSNNNDQFDYLCGNLKKEFSPGDLTDCTRDDTTTQGYIYYWPSSNNIVFSPGEYYFFKIKGQSNTSIHIRVNNTIYDTDIKESDYILNSVILLKTIEENGYVKFIYYLGNKTNLSSEAKTLLQNLCNATGVTYSLSS